jgi:hypothetical protein
MPKRLIEVFTQDNYPTYRLTDPETSQQPVRNKVRLKATALAAIEQHPGITAGKLGEVTGIDGIWKRLPEMERDGLIIRGRPARYFGTGRFQTTWTIVEKQLELELEANYANGNTESPSF